MSRFNRTTAPRFLMGLALCLGLAAHAHAAPITGDPVGNAFGWVPNSTNALNYTSLVPGREGQTAPYVLFNSSTTGSVLLDFFNYPTAGVAYFETRIDGIATDFGPHPIVTGDTIHGGTYLLNQTEWLSKEFTAASYVDIRLALGGERDWDFDWVRFEVAQNAVPEPATLGLLGVGLFGLAALRRRRRD